MFRIARSVLLHGAWHGGWCSRDTARALRDAGHTVFTPTHSSVGERAHQSVEAITLETHIRDLCGVCEADELSDVILAGHSDGGMAITGVADRLPGRVKALAYVDAFVPEHGDCLVDLLADRWDPSPSRYFAARLEAAAGWRVAKLPCSHDMMVDMPTALARELLSLA